MEATYESHASCLENIYVSENSRLTELLNSRKTETFGIKCKYQVVFPDIRTTHDNLAHYGPKGTAINRN